jgi:hypothetical protein
MHNCSNVGDALPPEGFKLTVKASAPAVLSTANIF